MGKKATKTTVPGDAPVEEPKVLEKTEGQGSTPVPGAPAAARVEERKAPEKKSSRKILVVYYSFEGNTKIIADTIAEAAGADTLRLEVQKEQQSHGFIKYLWGGRQVVMKSKPKLVMPFDKHASDYDVIFIGTPVWAFNFAPALRTFFSSVALTGKKIALFCSCGGDRRKTFENMRAQLPGNEFLGEFEAVDPLKHDLDGQRQRAADWARKMLES
ncbi:MAG: flavodoxin [Candidatus Lokiarchaeota archaeon]|nr:flavodoxin [Candidatus Lokiarchaeota archaeon]